MQVCCGVTTDSMTAARSYISGSALTQSST
jgi:hypothetical protein